MALIKPNFDDVAGQLEPGTYPARILANELRTSQSSGKPYVNWTLQLFGDSKWNNRQVFLMTPTTGKGAFRLQNLYRAATGETMIAGSDFDTDQLNGREITVTLVKGHDQQGEERIEVKSTAAYKA